MSVEQYVMQRLHYAKCDFSWKGMKGIFVYVQDYLLTFDKMQNISTLMCIRSKSEGRVF